MKFLIPVLFAACVAACGDSSSPAAAPGLEHYRGSWVLINYWAEWCGPCIEEIPELNAFAQTHPEVVVLGVNFDGATGEELAEQERSLGVAFRTLAQDPSAALGIRRPAVLPTTLLVTPGGEVAATLIGPQTEKSLHEALGAARETAAAP